MDRTYVDGLLLKARATAEYAIQTGQYPKESRLLAEIDVYQRALDQGDSVPVEPLIKEMQRVCDEIGATPKQVMELATVVGRWRRKAALVTPYLIGFLTLMLTGYLAFQSSELHKADLALREHQEMVRENLQEKVYLAWKMYRYEDVLNIKPPLAQLDSYQKLVDDVKRVYWKGKAVGDLLAEASLIRYVPKTFESHGPCGLRALARVLNGAPAPLASERDDCPQAAEKLDGAELTSDKPECSAELRSPVIGDRTGKLNGNGNGNGNGKVDLAAYDRSFVCFLMSLGLGGDYSYPRDALIYSTRNKVNLLISWLLPGLYGLLGACVFLMRRMLSADAPGKNPARIGVVHMLSLLLRAALGGLAGIIIGWFWVPTSLTATSSSIAVSAVPFGIAFLAGFSIDSLFALLEGLVKSFSARGGSADAGPASHPRPTGQQASRAIGTPDHASSDELVHSPARA
jgi:hypothetical protein